MPKISWTRILGSIANRREIAAGWHVAKACPRGIASSDGWWTDTGIKWFRSKVVVHLSPNAVYENVEVVLLADRRTDKKVDSSLGTRSFVVIACKRAVVVCQTVRQCCSRWTK